MPTWVRLLGLPLEFWEKGIFQGIANSFGSLLVIDKITQERLRLVYAHICVNVAVNIVLPSSVLLKSMFGNWTQTLEYENAHLFC